MCVYLNVNWYSLGLTSNLWQYQPSRWFYLE